MTVYNAPLRDMQFVLHDVLNIAKYSNLPGFADATPDVVDAILEEGGKLASNVLHPLNQLHHPHRLLLQNRSFQTERPTNQHQNPSRLYRNRPQLIQ